MSTIGLIFILIGVGTFSRAVTKFLINLDTPTAQTHNHTHHTSSKEDNT